MFTLIFSMLFFQIAQDRPAPAEEERTRERARIKVPTLTVGNISVVESDEGDTWVLTFLPTDAIDAKDVLERSVVIRADKATGVFTTILDGPAQTAAALGEALVTTFQCTSNACGGQSCSALFGKVLCVWHTCCSEKSNECTRPIPWCTELPL